MTGLERIRAEEREDWNLNAAFYRAEDQALLLHDLERRRDAYYAIRPGECVLDVGCGSGATVAALRARGVQAHGVDYAEAMVDVARTVHGLESFVTVADAEDLPFESETFDVVIVNGVLHHLAVQERLPSSLRELHRVLKPGGRLCMFDRNGSLLSNGFSKACVLLKEVLRWVAGRERFASCASRNEPAFGGPRDLLLIANEGFRLIRRKDVSSLPFFASVVVCHAAQYFLGERAGRRLERWLHRPAAWLDARLPYRPLCVEQVCVLESVPASLPRGTRDAHISQVSSRTRLPLLPGVPERRDECSPALSRRAGTGVVVATPSPDPKGTAEPDSHHLGAQEHEPLRLRGGRS